ncbi:Nitrilase and fragile histidine triad fusion protein NitFhit [Fasciola hepatica]|uniref:Nitrilase and fragile histidine triad fusion protein NitFhit n=1 Tax=Fasciola hepatica TaxID=6192 RepID=A0A4E0RCR8_FASHE|nr:Nitrilase and fragile histidine triad fusion protein NitFhit [Fasciola hepatica]
MISRFSDQFLFFLIKKLVIWLNIYSWDFDEEFLSQSFGYGVNHFISNVEDKSFSLSHFGTFVTLFQHLMTLLRYFLRLTPAQIRSLGSMSTKIGVIQMTSSADKDSNFQQAKRLITEASSKGAQMMFLPECFDFIGVSRTETLKTAEHLDGPLISAYRTLAKELRVWLSLGGAHRKVDFAEDERICNTHIIIDAQGQVAGLYDKVHLFDVNIDSTGENESERMVISESRVIRPGVMFPPAVRNTPIGTLGLAICYDMRFPELSTYLRYSQKADVLTYPSAFSLPTGQAGHWHILLRARAIENQCYVIAAAQEGVHNAKRSSYGHSLVVDPWGKVLAEQSNPGPGLLLCELDIGPTDFARAGSSLRRARRSIPVESHRRVDLFPTVDGGLLRDIGTDDYQFGPHTIKASHVFYRSAQSFAFVNLSPLVPGRILFTAVVFCLDSFYFLPYHHSFSGSGSQEWIIYVLVSPVAPCVRFADLKPGQLTDLYLTVRQVSQPIANYFNATSLTISIQDGKDAGQSVPHVHVHVLPRKPNDFPHNDDIYQAKKKIRKI